MEEGEVQFKYRDKDSKKMDETLRKNSKIKMAQALLTQSRRIDTSEVQRHQIAHILNEEEEEEEMEFDYDSSISIPKDLQIDTYEEGDNISSSSIIHEPQVSRTDSLLPLALRKELDDLSSSSATNGRSLSPIRPRNGGGDGEGGNEVDPSIPQCQIKTRIMKRDVLTNVIHHIFSLPLTKKFEVLKLGFCGLYEIPMNEISTIEFGFDGADLDAGSTPLDLDLEENGEYLVDITIPPRR